MPESVRDRPTRSHEYVFLLAKSGRYFYDAEAVKEACGPFKPCGPGSRADNGRDPAHGTRKQDAIGKGTYTGFNTRWRSNPTSKRNLRSVWPVATEPYPEAHFATFPSRLAEPCIKAGTSEKGCCPECGAPWERIIARTNEPQWNARGSRFDKGKTFQRDKGDRTQRGERYQTRPIGWRPGCDCGHGEAVPCIVLDPFMGSGTVAIVAEALGRDWLGIELNPDYVEMAERRILKARGAPLPATDAEATANLPLFDGLQEGR